MCVTVLMLRLATWVSNQTRSKRCQENALCNSNSATKAVTGGAEVVKVVLMSHLQYVL